MNLENTPAFRGLMSDIEEMVASCLAVKGPAFVNTVLLIYESMQQLQIVTRLDRSASRSMSVPLAKSMANRAIYGMSEEDATEALMMAQRMSLRHVAVHNELLRGG
jgi:hypothetical protein